MLINNYNTGHKVKRTNKNKNLKKREIQNSGIGKDFMEDLAYDLGL